MQVRVSNEAHGKNRGKKGAAKSCPETKKAPHHILGRGANVGQLVLGLLRDAVRVHIKQFRRLGERVHGGRRDRRRARRVGDARRAVVAVPADRCHLGRTAVGVRAGGGESQCAPDGARQSSRGGNKRDDEKR